MHITQGRMRIAETTDLATVERLARTIWREYYPRILAPEQIEYMLDRMYAQAALAADQKRGVHFALIGDAGFLACETTGAVCKLHKLYLLDRARGKGVGQAAIAYVDAYAQKTGATSVQLNVNKHNIQAQKSYARAGYTRLREEVIDIGGGYVMDDFVYEKRLTPSPAT